MCNPFKNRVKVGLALNGLFSLKHVQSEFLLVFAVFAFVTIAQAEANDDHIGNINDNDNAKIRSQSDKFFLASSFTPVVTAHQSSE